MELPTRYIGFDEAIARAEARLPADLRSYLEGHAAGVNARSAQLRQSWESSTDPHIQYMVQRGLHLRQGKVRDAIAAFTKLTADFAIGAYNTWADNISRIAPIQVEASLYKPFKKSFYFTASNELGVSGRVTASGRPMIVLDPHMPTHTDFWNRNMSVVIRTRQDNRR